MRKMLMGFTLILLMVGLSGCFLIDDKTSCNIDVSDEVNQTGTLYKTKCQGDWTPRYGLINTNLELVIKEDYIILDRGFKINHQGYTNIVFQEEVEYFRAVLLEGTDYRQRVINRLGETIIETEYSTDILISRNQELIYMYDGSTQIYHLSTETYESVNYRIVRNMGDYFIADMGDSEIILDHNFQPINEDSYEIVLYVSTENLIYKKDDRVYSKNLLTNTVVSLFSTIEYPSYSVNNDWSEYVRINPNSYRSVFFINSHTGETVDIEGCSRIVTKYQDTFTMRCDVGYKLFTQDSLEALLEIPRNNTYILRSHPVFLTHDEEQTTLHSISEVMTFDQALVSYKILYGDLLEVLTESGNIYINLQTYKKLYETDQTCMDVLNAYRADFLFHKGDCNITQMDESLRVISLEHSSLKRSDVLEFQYYTDDLLFFVKDGKTVITDYDLNILYE